MKAVILAAGIASRLRPYTDNLPKALVELNNGETILDRILTSLQNNGITEIVMTTGHQEEKLKLFIKKNPKYKNLNFTFVFNPKYSETNYIYSLFLAKDKIVGDDMLLIHGDMVFDFPVMDNLIKQKKSAGMVNKSIPVPEKDFKARIKNGKIVEVSVSIFGENIFAFMPLYNVKKADVKKWFVEIEKFVNAEDVKVYAENAFNKISETMDISPLYYTTEVCMEVDNAEDLEKAKKLLSK